ncbi:hypothetical protein NKJ70_10215 [Mesorhizobium sp. M0092]
MQSRLRILGIAAKDGTYRVRIAVEGNGFNGDGDMVFTLDGERISGLVIS